MEHNEFCLYLVASSPTEERFPLSTWLNLNNCPGTKGAPHTFDHLGGADTGGVLGIKVIFHIWSNQRWRCSGESMVCLLSAHVTIGFVRDKNNKQWKVYIFISSFIYGFIDIKPPLRCLEHPLTAFTAVIVSEKKGLSKSLNIFISEHFALICIF